MFYEHFAKSGGCPISFIPRSPERNRGAKGNQNLPNRKSCRLKGWDYSGDGYYFVTICMNNGENFFGDIFQWKMKLSAIGKIAQKYWQDIPNHFNNAFLDEFIIMPNHLHGIVVINNNLNDRGNDFGLGNSNNQQNFVHRYGRDEALPRPYRGEYPRLSKISPKPKSLPTIIGSYKSIVKKWCNKNNYQYFQWQPRFYDHIIRHEKSLNNVRQYIANNPKNWQRDRNN